MAKQNIYQWCEQNNWTEPRQLADGIWVAFPPGGVIETPLPLSPLSQQATVSISNRMLDIVYSLVLVIATIVIGAIALIMSPLFLASIVYRSQKNKLMS